MANNPLDVVMIKEIIRLKQSGQSNSLISRSLGVSRTTVIKYLKQIEYSGLDIEELEQLSEQALHDLFITENTQDEKQRYSNLEEFFPYVDKELKKTGVTRWGLWAEYQSKHPGAYSYSQFCFHYQQWSIHKQAYLNIEHKAGDKLFVDYAGKKLQIADTDTGELKQVEVFVATLGASQMTYVEASESQKLECFLKSVENALWYFGGVPQAIVPDNLKAAVAKSNKYEPTINESFAQLSNHYQTSILPARSRKPKDKALVEGAVKIVYHRIYAALLNRVFYSIAELNRAILQLLITYNQTPFQGKDHSRKDLFVEIDLPALKPLVANRFEFKTYKQATVQKNCHISISEDKNYYSVPYQYIGKKVKVAYNTDVVEIYLNYKRIALHQRSMKKYCYTTLKEHLPAHHRFIMDWNPDKFLRWAESIGQSTKELIRIILESKAHPEQAYKSCQGILSMAGKTNKQRLDDACKRALHYKAHTYQSVRNIIDKGLEKQPLEEHVTQIQIPFHENIRGAHYYQ
jgi:transposase